MTSKSPPKTSLEWQQLVPSDTAAYGKTIGKTQNNAHKRLTLPHKFDKKHVFLPKPHQTITMISDIRDFTGSCHVPIRNVCSVSRLHWHNPTIHHFCRTLLRCRSCRPIVGETKSMKLLPLCVGNYGITTVCYRIPA